MATLSLAQLKQLASHGAKARLSELRAEIGAILKAFPVVGVAEGRKSGQRSGRKRGTLSPAGRARIAAAQRARWAAVKQAKSAAAGAIAAGRKKHKKRKKRKKMSAAARKAIGVRMTKTWAERRKAGKK